MAANPLANIRVVLVETSHPGNIGAAARAMKTMGLENLWLVNPNEFPSAPATARAAGADDILYHATVVASLEDAIADCTFAVATTARRREIAVPVKDPRTHAPDLLARAYGGPVALVFGRESSGLNNDEVRQCQGLIEIPSNPAYSSLNLAAAVQVIAYELRAAWQEGSADTAAAQGDEVPVSVSQLEGLYEHFERALTAIGYLDPAHPKKLMARLRALYGRAGLTASELQILRGTLTAAEQMAAREAPDD